MEEEARRSVRRRGSLLPSSTEPLETAADSQLLGPGMAYHMILVHDWGDDTFGAVVCRVLSKAHRIHLPRFTDSLPGQARRKRLQRISLHRPLSSSEQAILDRPWPTGAPEFVNFWDMWTDAMASHRARAAEREERKRLWEARHAADAGLSAESSSAAGRGAGAAASSSSSARRGGGVSEELPDVDWAKVVVQDGKQGDHP